MLLQFYDGSRWSEERFSRHTFAFSCRSYALTLHCVNGTWHLRLPQELQLVSSEDCIYRHIFIVKDTVCSYPIYLFEQEEPCVFHKYSLVSKNRITFGGSPEADIQIFDERVKGIVFSMDISNRQFCIQEDTIPLVKEGVRVTTSSIQLDGMYAFLNCHFLLQGEFLMLEEVPNVLTTLDFYVSPQCMHSFENRQPVSIEYLVIIKADSAFQKEVHLPHVTEEPIRRPLIFLLGPTVCMSLGSLVTGILSSQQRYLETGDITVFLRTLLLPCAMLLSVFLFTPWNALYDRRQWKKKKAKVEQQVQKELDELEKAYVIQRDALHAQLEEVFLLPYALFQRTVMEERIQPVDRFSDYFLCLCLGVNRSSYPFTVRIDSCYRNRMKALYEEKEHRFVLDLKQLHSLQIYNPDQALIRYILLQLVTHFSYRDLSLILVQEKEQFPLFERLPHIDRILSVSQIPAILENLPEDRTTLFLCFEEESARALKENHTLYFSEIDNAVYPCMIAFQDGKGRYTNRIEGTEEAFTMPETEKDLFDPIVSRLLIGYPLRIEENLSFLACHELGKDIVQIVSENWKRGSVQSHLYARLGVDEHNEVLKVDIHEKGNGPHGLIAGMTGSGKSECILSLLFSLIVQYSYEDVSIALIDFKGGSLVQSLKLEGYTVPHLVGYVSNLDAIELERAFIGFSMECRRREQYFSSLHEAVHKPIDSIDTFQKWWKEEYGIPYLGHLVIVVDEFAELKQEHPEFMDSLISIARIGRSLGIHLLLSTQRPAGVISSQILSNTSFQICLKVQDEQDSREVLGSKEAAFLQHPGEFLMKSGRVIKKGRSFYTNGEKEHADRIEVQDLYAGTHHLSANDGISMTEREILLQEMKKIPVQSMHQLWLPPLEKVDRDETGGEVIGILDEYYLQKYVPYTSKNTNAVCGKQSRKRKQLLLSHIYNIVSDTKEKELFWIGQRQDSLSFFNGQSDCEDRDAFEELRKHLKENTLPLYLFIEDVDQFLNEDMDRMYWLRQCIVQAQDWDVHLYLGMKDTQDLRYRDLANIENRLLLDSTDPIQDAGFLGSRVESRALKENQCLVNREGHTCPVTYPLLTEEEFNRLCSLPEPKGYSLFAMPERILPAVSEGKILLGLQYGNGRKVCIKKKVPLILVYGSEKESDDLFHFLEQSLSQVERISVDAFNRNSFVYADRALLFLSECYGEQYAFKMHGKMQLKQGDGVYVQNHVAVKMKMVEIDEETDIPVFCPEEGMENVAGE